MLPSASKPIGASRSAWAALPLISRQVHRLPQPATIVARSSKSKDRVLYPVVENKSSRRFLRGLLGIETPLRVTYFFMFRGDEPLNLTAYTPAPQTFTARPTDNPKDFNKLLDGWWEATENHYQQVFRSAAYPAIVDNYLTATWARRLNRQMPEP